MNAVMQPKPPTLAEFIAQHPDADPKDLLQIVLAETQRLKEYNDWKTQEFREAAEVALDDNLNFKPKTMAQLQRLARMYAESGLVPDHYKNNVAGCAIGIQMALRMHVDILTFLQCSFVHKGKIGIEAKLAMARLNTSGKIKGRVTYSVERDANKKIIRCTASAVDADSGEVFSQTVDWDMVTGEGWDRDNGSQKSKWKTLPELMFQYRSGIFLARVHYPDVLLGMYTIEELEDMARSNGDAGAVTVTAASLGELSERLGAAPKQPARRRKSQESPAEPPDTAAAGSAAHGAASEPSKTSEVPRAAGKAKEPASEPPKAEESKPVSTRTKAASQGKEATPAATKSSGKVYSVPELVSMATTLLGEDAGQFDLQRLAEHAATFHKPMLAILAVKERGPDSGWENFLIDSGETDQAEVNQDPGDEDVNQDPDGRPEVLERPAMGHKGLGYEKSINDYRQAKRIEDLCSKAEIIGNPHLSDEEQEYLLSLGKARIWDLRNATSQGDLPGMK